MILPSPRFLQGLAVCTERAKPAKFYSRYGYTGCGYTWNTQSQGKDSTRIVSLGRKLSKMGLLCTSFVAIFTGRAKMKTN